MSGLGWSFLGCGDAFGSGGRLQTCFLVQGGGTTFLVDCGTSSLIAMRRFGADPNAVFAENGETPLHAVALDRNGVMLTARYILEGGEFTVEKAWEATWRGVESEKAGPAELELPVYVMVVDSKGVCYVSGVSKVLDGRALPGIGHLLHESGGK